MSPFTAVKFNIGRRKKKKGIEHHHKVQNTQQSQNKTKQKRNRDMTEEAANVAETRKRTALNYYNHLTSVRGASESKEKTRIR
jgi:hypothetical protein